MSHLFPRRVETDRLVLTPLHEVDAYRFYEICSSDEGIEEVTRYLTWNPHKTPKDTVDFLDQAEEYWEDGESAQYVVRPATGEDGAGEIAGTTGLHPDWDRRFARFGLWLRKQFWGRGYSGERAEALLAIAFDHLDLQLVAVSHMDGNERSRKAIERYVDEHGGRHEGLLRGFVTGDDGGVDAHRYTVTRDEFRNNSGPAPKY
jgi:RimJ/RimL family protein N-acetyltransferase